MTPATGTLDAACAYGFLFPHHEELIRASGISPEVARARGYASVDMKATLGRHGFGPAQRQVPGLLLAVWRATGERAFAQYRPDVPRTSAAGKVVKYETPAKVGMALDVHPFARKWIGDPGRPLFITEGIRKGDAAVSLGLCCVALLGVWNWRGRNGQGGKVALPDWELVALDGRQVYIVFDSDVMLKPEVHTAMVRLRAFLEMRGAKLGLIYLPAGEGGAKTGLDDYLARHSVGSLIALATTKIRGTAPKPPVSPSVTGLTPLHLADLRARAGSVLAAPDPLAAFSEALPGCGYGGDTRPVQVTYLSMTTRLLRVRPGAMPAHLLLVAPPSSGKNHTVNTALRFLPSEAYHVIDAGSPRILIYDDADLRHRVVIFGEADSLPAGEDNPAASAIRNLLQDHKLHYKVTQREPETGRFIVRSIEKPGPTVCVTTAVRRLGPQLESRFFVMEIPDDQQQIRAALQTQAAVELRGAADPPEALVAFQEYLQALAPWEVIVPFADVLAEAVGQSPSAPRVLRDFARLLSLIKATAVLRHAHRSHDRDGRLVAEVEDYATVYELISDIYTASATGAGTKIRETVEAVAVLKAEGRDPISVTTVADRLGITKQAASGRISTALRGGWLVNREERSGRPYRLDAGEPLPAGTGLPTPSALGCQGVKAQTEGKEARVVDEVLLA